MCEGGKIVEHTCETIPALHTIFDEILVNASDNAQATPPTTRIWVEVSVEGIRVTNNGRHIPVKPHPTEKCCIPSLLFGHLLTSEHYNDAKQRTSGGLNGLGAKLANIYSSSFTVTCHDPNEHLLFTQTWTNNMQQTHPPHMKKKKKHPWTTSVSFLPDEKVFGAWFGEVNVALFRKRVWDIAAFLGKGVQVYWNQERIRINRTQYRQLYPVQQVHVLISSPNLEFALAASNDDAYHQVSFVNGLCTRLGGTHVEALTQQVLTHAQSILRKRNKHSMSKLTKQAIRSQLFVFVQANVVNPHFSSQTKEELTSPGSEATISYDDVLRGLRKTGVLQRLETWLKEKERSQLERKLSGSKKKKRLLGIPKCTDAQKAGTKQSKDTYLIITEGDSAATMAVTGLEVVGRQNFGVFPLKGKPLNVQSASKRQLATNTEIQNIVKIVGLEWGKTYTSLDDLRYGHLVIMADQDVDGFHIAGLLVNFIATFWPSLLALPFLYRFITPLVKVKQNEFFDWHSFEQWEGAKGAAKYYKGLGTSTPKETKAYFRDLRRYLKPITFDSDHWEDNLRLVFSPTMVAARKQWMMNDAPPSVVPYTHNTLRFRDMVHGELLTYSRTTLRRAIPHVMDGLKKSQRQCLFGCFAKLGVGECKVAQLASFIAEKSMYLHGEVSLCSTLVSMCQDFVGSNNVPLLQGNGQFGSRIQNGKDAASPRYIYTELPKRTRLLFPEVDTPLLQSQSVEGKTVEPAYYLPLLPIVLLNGSNGVATGFRSFLFARHPRTVLDNVFRCLRGHELLAMPPTILGYRGIIDEDGVSHGLFSVQKNVIHITELPLGTSILQYKQFLHQCDWVRSLEEHHTDDSVQFKVWVKKEEAFDERRLRLCKKHPESMFLLNAQGNVQRFSSVEHILRVFVDQRLALYVQRKTLLCENLREKVRGGQRQFAFLEAVLGGSFPLFTASPEEIQTHMDQHGWPMTFLNLNLRCLTKERLSDLTSSVHTWTDELASISQCTPQQMYERDLQEMAAFLPFKNCKRQK
jgi:DNA topoisomerase-2